MVAERAVQSAPNWLTSPFESASHSSLLNIILNARFRLKRCENLRSTVRRSPVTRMAEISGMPHTMSSTFPTQSVSAESQLLVGSTVAAGIAGAVVTPLATSASADSATSTAFVAAGAADASSEANAAAASLGKTLPIPNNPPLFLIISSPSLRTPRAGGATCFTF